MASPINDKLAVLIDADNAEAAVIHELLEEVALYGTASVKRAYGNWTTPQLGAWKDVLHEYAIQPMQQFSYTTGKNATDSALIIDAMDLLHTGNLNGFCLVSSDSDFTRLAGRIREEGLMVYGFGQKKTPKPFVKACNKFIYTENLKPKKKKAASPKAGPVSAPVVAVENELEPLEEILRNAVTTSTRDREWTALGGLGSLILKSHPDFDSRTYGFGKLSDLVRKQKYLDVQEVPTPDGNVQLQVRLKAKK
jgi:uncharacterized LabA/DUF88 family protein